MTEGLRFQCSTLQIKYVMSEVRGQVQEIMVKTNQLKSSQHGKSDFMGPAFFSSPIATEAKVLLQNLS